MNVCPHCGATFVNRWNVDRHVNRFHPTTISSVNSDLLYGKGSADWRGGGVNPRWKTAHYEDDERDDRSVENYDHEANFKSGQERSDNDVESDDEQRDYIESDESGDDAARRPDVFDDVDLDNSSQDSDNSSLDSDDCDSDSEHSSGSEETMENDEATLESESVEKTPERPRCNFARWRGSDGGLYTIWKSLSRKPHIVKHREFLTDLICDTSHKSWRRLIKATSDSQIEAFREIARNLLVGRVPLPTTIIAKAKKYRLALRFLADDKNSFKELRRTLLAERDGLLPLLLLHTIPSRIKSPKVIFNHVVEDAS